jgi:hypothetical protein
MSQSFEAWIKSLPDSNPPSWIGLPMTAERQLKRIIAQKALSHLAIVNGLAEIEIESSSSDMTGGVSNVNHPLRKNLLETLTHWMHLISGKNTSQLIDSVISGLSSQVTVLTRTLAREAVQARNVMAVIVQDILAMMYVIVC